MSENEKQLAISFGNKKTWRVGLIGGAIAFVSCGIIIALKLY